MSDIKYPISITGLPYHPEESRKITPEYLHQFKNSVAPFHMRKQKQFPHRDNHDLVISAPAAVIHGFLSSISNYGSLFPYNNDDMPASENNDLSLLRYNGNHPAAALGNMYKHVLKQFYYGRFNLQRGTEPEGFHLDRLLVGLMPFNLFLLSFELFFKVVGGLLSSPIRFFFKHANNTVIDSNNTKVDISPGWRFLSGIGFVVSWVVFWPLSQLAFTLGNLANSVRKILDGIFNVFISSAAFLKDGIHQPTYGHTYPEIHHAIGSIAKNILLLGSVPLVNIAVNFILMRITPFLKRCFGDITPPPTPTNHLARPPSSVELAARPKTTSTPTVSVTIAPGSGSTHSQIRHTQLGTMTEVVENENENGNKSSSQAIITGTFFEAPVSDTVDLEKTRQREQSQDSKTQFDTISNISNSSQSRSRTSVVFFPTRDNTTNSAPINVQPPTQPIPSTSANLNVRNGTE